MLLLLLWPGLNKRDARLTLQNIAYSVNILLGSVHKILTQQQELRKVCARWAPIAWQNNKKAASMKISINSFNKCENGARSKISELLTVDGT